MIVLYRPVFFTFHFLWASSWTTSEFILAFVMYVRLGEFEVVPFKFFLCVISPSSFDVMNIWGCCDRGAQWIFQVVLLNCFLLSRLRRAQWNFTHNSCSLQHIRNNFNIYNLTKLINIFSLALSLYSLDMVIDIFGGGWNFLTGFL